MPKFSAYMRGEEGPKGDIGQAALINGIIDETIGERLPIPSQQENLAYYVKKNDGLYLYTSLSSEATWVNQGNVTIGFSTKQPTSVTTINWNESATVQIIPNNNSSNGSKSFNWNFWIPRGREAGFSASQLTTVESLSSGVTPYVNIEDTSTPFYEKQFKFNFGIPVGVAAGFSTKINAGATILSYTTLPTVSITADGPETSKNFYFAFGIPQGEPAGFGTLSSTVRILDHLAPPTFEIEESGTNMQKNLKFKLGIPAAHPAKIKSITTSTTLKDYTYPAIVSATATGNDWEKEFKFDFQIPQGRAGGFTTSNMQTVVNTLPSSSNATVTVAPIASTPDYAKQFKFTFGIPHGEAADFGEPIISVESLSSHANPTASITTSGSATTKVFNFHFGIPQGLKGDTGDALAIYEPISFNTNSSYWTGNDLHIPRGTNEKVPLYIYNNDKLSIAATFKLTNNEIIYEADEKFNGTIYLVSKTNKTIVKINSITTTSYSYAEQHPEELITENIESTSSDILWDIKLPTGPVGGTDDTGWIGFNENTSFQYRKIGKFIEIRTNSPIASPSVASKSYNAFAATIPSECRPSINIPLTCLVTAFNSQSYSDRLIGCYLGTNGKITLFSGNEAIPSNLSLTIHGMYLIN